MFATFAFKFASLHKPFFGNRKKLKVAVQSGYQVWRCTSYTGERITDVIRNAASSVRPQADGQIDKPNA